MSEANAPERMPPSECPKMIFYGWIYGETISIQSMSTSSSSSKTIATLILWGVGRSTFTIKDIDLSTYKLADNELVNVCCLRVSKIDKTTYDKDAFWTFCLNNLPLMKVLVSIQFECFIEDHSVIVQFDEMLRYHQIHYHMSNLNYARYIICPKIMNSSNPYKKLTLSEFIQSQSEMYSKLSGKNIAE